MDSENLKGWTEIAKNLITTAGLLLGGFWAWSRFVVERGLMPPSQLELSLNTVGVTEEANLLEIVVKIANKGSSALIVTDLKVRLRYIRDDRDIRIETNPDRSFFGRVHFPYAAVLNEVGAEKRTVKYAKSRQATELNAGEFLVVPYDTFVQPSVEQLYTFVTALPRTAQYVLILASFRYQLRPSKAQKAILRISRHLGIIQYSLGHVQEPHTVERSFKIPDVAVNFDK